MKVILLKDVRGVGQHHEVKSVADGYAINFLFPKKLAEPATDEKVQSLEAQKKAHETEVEKQEEALAAKIVTLRGKRIALQAKATEKGGLFKTIAPKDIALAIAAEHGVEIGEAAVHFPEPIKTTGDHTVLLQSKTQKVELRASVVPKA